MDILLGTNNKGKVIEIGEVLQDLPVILHTLADLDITSDPDETGTSYAENAALKAQHFFTFSQMPTLADDSGIVVDALADELGIHTRRWGAGASATDEQWIEHFLERMRDEPNRKARFICTLAYVDADGQLHTFEGRCDGEITHELEADFLPGLPISACFRPDGCDKVFSALTIDEKNQSSHRGRAAHAFKQYLQNVLGT